MSVGGECVSGVWRSDKRRGHVSECTAAAQDKERPALGDRTSPHEGWITTYPPPYRPAHTAALLGGGRCSGVAVEAPHVSLQIIQPVFPD